MRGRPFSRGHDPRRHILTASDRPRAFVVTAMLWSDRAGDGTPNEPSGMGARMFYKALTRWKAGRS